MGWPYLRAWTRSRYVASVALPGSCFTWDLIVLANWLKSRGIETVAMQSTGVYWIPLYDILEERGIRVFLVNARDTKNMPGRQSDIQECRWLLKLQVYGLLKSSFRPCGGDPYNAHVLAAAATTDWGCVPLRPAHAEGADANASATGQRHQWMPGQAIVGAILEGERNPQV